MRPDPRDMTPDWAHLRAPEVVPDGVRRLVDDEPVELVWRNQLGGLTVRTKWHGADAMIKWQPGGAVDLASEADRLRWASAWHPVPEVLADGQDGDDGWLVTATIDARSAVDPHWIADPATAVAALGKGLRALHDSLPVEDCVWKLDAPGLPQPDRLVVAHGDACSPNTLIADDGRWAAHVDLGLLGVADRWLDLAVGSMSLTWNFGEGWEPAYFAAYGIESDSARIRAWRDWWHAGGDDANLPSVRARALD